MAQGGSNLENRSLAIDLCGVMVLWEERRIKELQAGPGQVPPSFRTCFVCRTDSTVYLHIFWLLVDTCNLCAQPHACAVNCLDVLVAVD